MDFDCINKELDDRGFAVVSGVIPPEDCVKYVSEYQEWLKMFQPGFPETAHNCLIQKYKAAHLDTTWRVRLKTKPVFAGLFGTEKLLSSTDAVAIGRPPEEGEVPFAVEGKNVLHHDQGPRKMGFHAYQGSVYLTESLEDDWCLMVMEGSHHHHKAFYEVYKPHQGQHSNCLPDEHRILNAEEKQWFGDRGCGVRRVGCPQGGMILWDSRLVHAGALPQRGRSNPGRWRFVTFVCMAPAAWAREKNLAVKRQAYEGLKCTRHWPAGDATIFDVEDTPEDIDVLPEVATTEEARRLAGVLPYDFNDGEPKGPLYTPQFDGEPQ